MKNDFLSNPPDLHVCVGRLLAGLLTACICLTPRSTCAEDFHWKESAGGEWANAANWDSSSGQFPNSPEANAIINILPARSAVITLPREKITVGGLTVGLGGSNDQAIWSIRGIGPLVFAGPDKTATVKSEEGVQSIECAVVLASNLVVEAKNSLRLVGAKPLAEEEGSWGIIVERGTLDLRMRGSFTGPSVIRNNASIITGRNNALGVGPVTVESGGRFTFVGEGSYIENEFTIFGDGQQLGALHLGTDRLPTEMQTARRTGQQMPEMSFKSGGFTGQITLGSDAAIGVAPKATGEISGSIQGHHTLTKLDQGKLVLKGSNTFSGGLRLAEGTLFAESLDSIPPANPIIMAGGTLEMTGNDRALGPLVLAENSTIILPAGSAGTLKFEDSRRQPWQADRTLIIKDWEKGPSGGQFKIIVGRDANGLTSTQLKQIRFHNPSGEPLPARILPNGELVPAS